MGEFQLKALVEVWNSVFHVRCLKTVARLFFTSWTSPCPSCGYSSQCVH